MRTRQTFVLHLLADPDEPEALRGLIHAVASGEEQVFSGGPALLALLRRMVSAGPQGEPTGASVKREPRGRGKRPRPSGHGKSHHDEEE